MLYLWIKALHIIAAVAWMAALFYLPRLYVYHADAAPGSELSETLKVMERRLLRAIMTPAMLAAWGFGLWLATLGGLWAAPWFHAKLLLLLGLSAMHGLCARWRRDFAADRRARPARFYRMMNEVPTVLLVGVVILAVVRPW